MNTERQNETFFFMVRKHDNLMRWVVGGQGFVSAYHSVMRNKGAAGVDGVKTQDLPRYLLHHWERIKTELLAGEYQPQLVRGVSIPKSNGGIRQLGIPTVMDRLVQQGIHQALSPIWEKDFSAFSYGFRPKRSAHDALKQATKYINAGRHWIIDLDLKSFFDRVHHDKLMSLISHRIADKTLLGLIRRYLQSGLFKDGVVQVRQKAVPRDQ
jgi:group II intron reverse transcriptase/maturase